MPDSRIKLAISDHIATLSLCNPRRHNALGAEDVDHILQLLAEVRNSPQVRVLVITNPEGNTFCAGAALDEIASGQLTSNQFAALPEAVAALPLPTIAAINGSAYGGGVELALACDFRLGVPHMKLHVPPARIGLCYPLSGIQRFVAVLGVTTAKRLLLTNEEFSEDDLLTLGFLSHLESRENLAAATQALAEKIAGLAPLAIATMKHLCDSISAGSLDRDHALALEARCNASNDLQEGLAAVLARRPPVFQGY